MLRLLHGRLLHQRLIGIRCCKAVTLADAVGAEEAPGEMVALNRQDGPAAHHSLRGALQLSADEDHPPTGRRQPLCMGYRIGDEGGAAMGKVVQQVSCGGTRIQVNEVILLYERRRKAGNLPLLLLLQPHLLGNGGLRSRKGAVQSYRTAENLGQTSGSIQGIQVSANRGFRNAQGLLDLRQGYAPLSFQELKNQFVSLFCQHNAPQLITR